MKLLVVGGGGREHALAAALRREHPAASIYCAPGNPGTVSCAVNLPIPINDFDGIVHAATAHAIDLVIIGPEGPLADGLADRLRAAHHAVLGPSAAAARIESSKAFAKQVMAAAGVPTAASATFTDLRAALAYVDAHAEPLVVKASGLAAGKGAVVCQTRADARNAVRHMLGDHVFGAAGDEVIVEEFLEGEELSVFAITNGRDITLLPAAQDHKRLLEEDKGPNTGGMGAYAPVRFATPELLQRIEQEVLEPTLQELERRGAPFRGILYAGLMIGTDGSPSVIEFNCRLGDPETQVVLPLVRNGLTEAFRCAAMGDPVPPLELSTDAAVTTVIASEGYPDHPRKGDPIHLPDIMPDGASIYHAGTTMVDGQLRTSGGRVVACTAVAATFAEAQRLSRVVADSILFEGRQFRRDIGWREAARATELPIER